MAIDRNAATKARLRRNAQQDGAGQGTALVIVGKPLFNSGTKITLTLDPLAGLVTNTNGLGVKLATLNSALTFDGAGGLHVTTADASLSLSSGGLSVNVGAAGGLSVPSLPAGLGIKLDGTSLATSATGALVNLAANSGLQIVSGLLLKLADTSLALGASGVAANLATNSGLQVSSGLLLKLADTSLQLAAGGVSAKLATNGGLSVSSGLLVTGLRVVSSDPGSPANGDDWYNSTSNLAKLRAAGMTASLPLILVADGKGTAVANTIAFTATNAVASLPANYLVAGRSIRVKAWGTYSTVGALTLIVGAFIDAANNLGDGTSIAVAGATTNARWYFECIFTCLTTGTTNTVRTAGYIYFETATTNIAVLGNTLNVNTANALTCESVAQFSVANAGNTLTSFGCEIGVIG